MLFTTILISFPHALHGSLVSISGEDEYFDVFSDSYLALMNHVRGEEGFWVSLCCGKRFKVSHPDRLVHPRISTEGSTWRPEPE